MKQKRRTTANPQPEKKLKKKPSQLALPKVPNELALITYLILTTLISCTPITKAITYTTRYKPYEKTAKNEARKTRNIFTFYTKLPN